MKKLYSIPFLAQLLAFEPNTYPINTHYRFNIVSQVFILLRFVYTSLFSFRPIPLLSRSHADIAFTFFDNESKIINILNIEHKENIILYQANLPATSFIPISLIITCIPDLIFFSVSCVRFYGFSSLQSISHPLISFLIFRYFSDLFLPDFRNIFNCVITTNCAHPYSLAVHAAAKVNYIESRFYEHTITPSNLVRTIDYDLIYTFSKLSYQRFLKLSLSSNLQYIPVHSLYIPDAVLVPKNPSTIGICVNDMDDPDSIFELIFALQSLPVTISIRDHPGNPNRYYFKQNCDKYNIPYNSNYGEGISGFIQSNSLIICGNSNVMIDCLRAQSPVVHFWSGTPDLFDVLGIASSYNIFSVNNVQNLLKSFDF